jgi:hypothetical protein
MKTAWIALIGILGSSSLATAEGENPRDQPESPAPSAWPDLVKKTANEWRGGTTQVCWAAYENGDQNCRIDDHKRVAYLALNADGTHHCTLNSIREGYKLQVVMWVPSGAADQYTISIEPGKTLSTFNIRGATEHFAHAGARRGLTQGLSGEQQGPYKLERTSGTLHNEDVSVTVTCEVCRVSQTHKLTVTPFYSINLVAIAGYSLSNERTYSVSNQMIQQQDLAHPIDYFIGATMYPLGWAKIAGSNVPGAYFDRWNWSRLMGIQAGVSLQHPTTRLYLGLSVNTPIGISFGLGYGPFRKQQLKDGYSTGSSYDGSDAPVDKVWSNRVLASISIDSSLVKPIIDIFK